MDRRDGIFARIAGVAAVALACCGGPAAAPAVTATNDP
jgi:hypothetical protein